jgi:subtilisin family serine protease
MRYLNEFIDKLLNESMGSIRYTQNSPILPDVWLECARNPGRPHELLLTPHSRSTPFALAQQLRQRLRILQDRSDSDLNGLDGKYRKQGARIAYNESNVVATLWFQEIVQVALPLTEWWSNFLFDGDSKDVIEQFKNDPGALSAELRETLYKTENRLTPMARIPQEGPAISPDLAWLGLIIGTLATIEKRKLAADSNDEDISDDQLMEGLQPIEAKAGESEEDKANRAEKSKQRLGDIVDALIPILDGMVHREDGPICLWLVNRNRETEASVYRSSRTVKADAVQTLFDVRGAGIRWAVIDSGIDATHIAFRKRNEQGKPFGPLKLDEGKPVFAAIESFDPQGEAELSKNQKANDDGVNGVFWGAFVLEPQKRPARPRPGWRPKLKWRNQTRIVKTYDFTRLRDWISAGSVENLPEDLKKKLNELKVRQEDFDEAVDDSLDKALKLGRMIDWELLAMLLEVPHDANYERPEHHHGTHVAGILGADWRADEHGLSPPEDRVGVAPKIEIYDLRALGKDGRGDEFTILAAMQFVRNLNARHNEMQIHGMNLSFSIRHKVASFACGRTPVCDEAERLVGNGVVVVAAAGNSGRARYLTTDDTIDEGYRDASITDPGNAASVITVGATHRVEQHNFGVSYFSSRGPTGDGRLKPDLVAPGEKISSTIPQNGEGKLDGTSMAAPHVSGAAALMLERNTELVGQPAKVKHLLCKAATDLGRERYYQGAGALDILRALQSV